METTHEPGHGYTTVNRRNITHLTEQRDRAGLQQLIDVLTAVTGPHAHDAVRLVDEARAAIATIDATTPRDVTPDSAGIRVGDILHHTVDGTERQGIVLELTDHAATTNHGDHVVLTT